MPMDIVTTNTDVETIDVEEEDVAKSPDASTERGTQTPHKVKGGEERPRSGADVPSDAGS